PAVVVRPVPADPDHGIDAASSAEHLAQRQGDGAASDVRARLVAVSPVVGRAQVLHPLRRGRQAGAPLPRPARPGSAKRGGVAAPRRRTVASVPSTSRRATTQPADPAPTIT